MIDFTKFKYRVGDKVRKIDPKTNGYAEYEIVDIDPIDYFGDSAYFHYKLKNLSSGCKDNPVWTNQNIVHNQFEPLNPAIKLLFKAPEKIAYTSFNEGCIGDVITFSSTSSKHIKGFYEIVSVSEPNRAKSPADDHSLDALRYASPCLGKR